MVHSMDVGVNDRVLRSVLPLALVMWGLRTQQRS